MKGSCRRSFCLIATLVSHSAAVALDGESEINLFYNKSKAGVDVLDQLSHAYSSQRSTRWWPFVFFMNLLNASAVASSVVSRVLNKIENEPTDKKRKNFILQMSEELTYDQIKRRAQHLVGLSKPTQAIMMDVMRDPTMPGTSFQPHRSSVSPSRRGRCYDCPRKKDSKVK